MPAPAKPRFTTHILKGAALVAYAKEVLRDWDDSRSVDDNLAGFRRSGSFGRASATRATEILRVLRSRYLDDDITRRALVQLYRARPETPTIELILGYHAAVVEPLLYAATVSFLYPWKRKGHRGIAVEDAVGYLEKLGVGNGNAGWSSRTTLEVARKLLTAWRDFGLLAGGTRKQFDTRAVPLLAFAWVATDRRQHQPADHLIEDTAFRLLLLSPEQVEDRLVAASARGLLDYRGGGTVSRIDWRYSNVEELARAVA